jgi:hypothetical protein
MKTKILLTLFAFPLLSYAVDSNYSTGWSTMNNDAFRSRFHVKGEIFVLDAAGTKLKSATSEIHEWQAGIKSSKIDTTWSVGSKGVSEIALHQVWQIKDDNSLEVNLQQYTSAERVEGDNNDYKYGRLVREERKTLENFAPITWVAETGKDYRVVLRLTPELEAINEGGSLDKIPIGADRGNFTVTDNQGYLWSDNTRFGGVLAGLTCHRGSFVISLYPFKGAKQLGFAMGKKMELNLAEKLRVKIVSDTDLVPGEMRVKVYGKYLPQLKTAGPWSAISYGQMDLSGFPKEFR